MFLYGLLIIDLERANSIFFETFICLVNAILRFTSAFLVLLLYCGEKLCGL